MGLTSVCLYMKFIFLRAGSVKFLRNNTSILLYVFSFKNVDRLWKVAMEGYLLVCIEEPFIVCNCE